MASIDPRARSALPGGRAPAPQHLRRRGHGGAGSRPLLGRLERGLRTAPTSRKAVARGARKREVAPHHLPERFPAGDRDRARPLDAQRRRDCSRAASQVSPCRLDRVSPHVGYGPRLDSQRVHLRGWDARSRYRCPRR